MAFKRLTANQERLVQVQYRAPKFYLLGDKMEDYKDTELLKIIKSYLNDDKIVNDICEILFPIMISKFGNTGLTINNLIFIEPKILYKETSNPYKSIFPDIIYVINRYKLENNIDMGFTYKQYEEVYEKNKAKEAIMLKKKKLSNDNYIKTKKAKRQIQIAKLNEDYDKKLLVTEQNVVDYLKSNKNFEFLPEDYVSSNMKDYHNYRIGSLVYNHPYRDKSIKDSSIYWVGMCDCGNYRVTQGGRIQDYTSCSSCEKPEHNFIGEKPHHLECIDQKYVISGKHSKSLKLKCKCDCGNVIILSPTQFLQPTKVYCHRFCKLAIENREKVFANQGEHFKPIFYKGTNVGKVGRKAPNSNSSTGYLGVYYVAQMNKYLAYLTFQGKREDLGYYDTPELAYKVRLAAQNIAQARFISEINDTDFIQDNPYLEKLLNRVKIKLLNNLNENK